MTQQHQLTLNPSEIHALAKLVDAACAPSLPTMREYQHTIAYCRETGQPNPILILRNALDKWLKGEK